MPTIPSYSNATVQELIDNGFEFLGDVAGETRNVTDDVLYNRMIILEENPQSGTTYTLVAGDQGKEVYMTNTSPKTLTIPVTSGFIIGAPIGIRNGGSGILNITPATGVTLLSVSLALEQHETAVLVPRATNSWKVYIAGTGGSSLTSLNPVTGLSATVNSSSQITLNWSDTNTSPNETNVLVQVSTNGTTYSTLATLGANSVTYAATGLTPGTLYYFRVINKGNGTTTTDSTFTQTSATTTGSSYLDSISWLGWFDPEQDITTVTSGSDLLVTAWEDQTTSNVNSKLLQPTTGKQPKLIAAAVNGHDVVEISATTWMDTVNFRIPATKPYTIMGMVRFTNFTGGGSIGYVINHGANQHDIGHWFGGSNQKMFMYSTAQVLSPSNLSSATVYIYCAVFYGDSTPDELYINDGTTPVATGDAGGNTAAPPGKIGIGDITDGGNGANARIGRIYAYNGVLSGAERAGAMNELKTYYGI